MFLRRAKIYESYEILNFYKNVIDSIENTEFKPMEWKLSEFKIYKKINFIWRIVDLQDKKQNNSKHYNK